MSTTTTIEHRPRRRRRILIPLLTAGAVLLAGAIGGYVWLDRTATVRVTGEPECAQAPVTGDSASRRADVAGICATIDGLTASWNAGDGAAYGDAFAEHATYTAFTGTIYQGRDDIADGHQALFDSFLDGSRVSTRYIGIHLTGSGSASVLARGDDYTGEQPPSDPGKVQSYTLTEQPDGRWLIDSFHNTQRSRVMERIQFLVNPDTVPAAER